MDVRKSLDKPKAVKRRGNGTSVEEFLLPHVAAKKILRVAVSFL